MGLVAGQARLLMLTAYKSDLEFQMQQICQKRLMLSANAQMAMTNEGLQKQLQQMDKSLELMQKQIETQHKAVETEYDSAKKVVDKNIEMSFKYFA